MVPYNKNHPGTNHKSTSNNNNHNYGSTSLIPDVSRNDSHDSGDVGSAWTTTTTTSTTTTSSWWSPFQKHHHQTKATESPPPLSLQPNDDHNEEEEATTTATHDTTPTNTNTNTSSSIWGMVYIMLGAFSFSVMFLLVKLMNHTNTFTLVWYRSWIQIALSLVTLWHAWHTRPQRPATRRSHTALDLEQAPPPPHPNEQDQQNNISMMDFFLGAASVRGWLMWRGLSGAAAVCAFFFGIQLLPLPDAVTLQFTVPPFVAVIAVCMVGEPWLPLDQVGAVVCLAGVVLIAHPTVLFGSTETSTTTTDQDGEKDTTAVWLQTVAVLVCTGGAALAGMAYVTVRKIGHRASATVMVLYYGAMSLPLTVLGSYLWEGTWRVWQSPPGSSSFSPWQWTCLMLIGLAGYGGQWCTNLGLQHETAAKATLATSTQIVWTYLFELTLLHEPLQVWSLAGTALILGYMLIVALVKQYYVPQSQQEQSQEVSTRKEPDERQALLSSSSTYFVDQEVAAAGPHENAPFRHPPTDGRTMR